MFMSESWTDERLNDLRDSVVEFRGETHREFLALRKEMKDGFAAVDREFTALRKEMKDGFAAVDREFAALRAEMAAEFAAVRREQVEEFTALRKEIKEGFEGIQRLMIQFMGGFIIALIGLLAVLKL